MFVSYAINKLSIPVNSSIRISRIVSVYIGNGAVTIFKVI